MAKKLKVLALFDAIRPTTLDQDLSAELKTPDWKTEAALLAALKELDYPHEQLAIFDDLDLLRQKLQTFTPDVIFNQADQFRNNRAFDQHIVSFLAMNEIPFTGCGATGLTLCKHKGISKKILSYHRIHTPHFVIIPRGRRAVRPKHLNFPILVKPLKEEASFGISQASFVETDEQFRERVAFIHESNGGNDVIAEEYIEGRELYVSVIGNHRLQVFPIRELVFREVPPDEPKIATYRAKWDEAYRAKWGLENRFAELEPTLVRHIESVCKRIYHLLTIDGYARIDLRLNAKNELYFIEANPNPALAPDEDFAQSALKAGVSYPQLIDRIARLGMKTLRD